MDTEQAWKIIESYFEKGSLRQPVRHQIESYNDFIQVQIPRTIEMFNPLQIKTEQDDLSFETIITFQNFRIQRPQIHENNGAVKLMFPQDARLRNFTYSSTMIVDLNIKYVIHGDQVVHKQLQNIQIGKLPIMLRSCICVLEQYKHLTPEQSGECSMDPGGYFIINGSEKTCIGQERAAENNVQCFHIGKTNNKWEWIAEIKSVPDFKCISPKQINMYLSSKSNEFGQDIVVQIPRINTPIPLFILFRAYGILSDKDICEHIVLDTNDKGEQTNALLKALRASTVEASGVLTQQEAIQYITQYAMYTPINMDKETGEEKKREFTENVLKGDVFPHCRTVEQRLYFMGYTANKLLRCSFGWTSPDDRDSYMNKRVDLTGTLLNNLFRNYFNKMIKEMTKQIRREVKAGSWRATENYAGIITMTNMYKIIKSSTLENGIKRALSTGDFGLKQMSSNKVGVAQVLNRLTYISSLSHLRRINTPVDKSGKLVPPRKLHPSSWGFICPAETPEGASVGVVKNLAYMTVVTIPSNSEPLYENVSPHVRSFSELTPSQRLHGVKVFVNGSWLGVAKDPLHLYADLKMKKEYGIIHIYTSVVFNTHKKEIHINNDAGRLVRPLRRVQGNALVPYTGPSKLKWEQLITSFVHNRAILEYVDAAEQNYSMVAMRPHELDAQANSQQVVRYTHCEIHPSTIFGVLASCIPFPENNQSPRNTYQCAMGKQAMGVYVTNYDKRMDKTAYVLTYPMRPLVDTRLMNMMNINQLPSGEQVVVAIMTHSGYNQEDSILFNKGAIDRGLFTATIYHTEKDENKSIDGDQEIRCKPDPSKTKAIKFGNYDKVNHEGIVAENTMLSNQDIIIAKVSPIKEARNDPTKVIKYFDQSKVFRTSEESYIDKNLIDRNGDGYKFCKVRVRTVRKPVIGDKCSSRHGQKGTIGNIIPEEDMPFLANGVRPDLIINPHAIPSRMTIAQLKETLLGKALLELGMFGDGTSFGDLQVSDICDELRRIGYESNGNELMYNGQTGEQLETSVFIGPVFYQRLKHMVNDKVHSRNCGPKVNLTRQPAEGRSRDGGLRYGEMERDGICSHGASAFNKERLYDVSDAYETHVCKRCGMIAAYNNEKHIHHCKTCENRTDFSKVKIPYACKLMFQELLTMNVAPRIMT